MVINELMPELTLFSYWNAYLDELINQASD
jgi:hypothetical protein